MDTSDGQVPDALALSAAALAEWNEQVETTLRGVAHALNNRAAALSAVMELSRAPTGDDLPAITSMLGEELERLGTLGAVVRSIGAPRRAVEAFAPGDVADEVGRILWLRGMHEVVIDAHAASPVRVERWMFLRAVLMVAARSERVRVVDDGDWITVTGVRAAPSALVQELALHMEGEPVDNGTERGFRVRNLSSVRRREAR